MIVLAVSGLHNLMLVTQRRAIVTIKGCAGIPLHLILGHSITAIRLGVLPEHLEAVRTVSHNIHIKRLRGLLLRRCHRLRNGVLDVADALGIHGRHSHIVLYTGRQTADHVGI